MNHREKVDEWAASVVSELPIDAVGLWQIVNGLRRHFKLSEVPNEEAVALAVCTFSTLAPGLSSGPAFPKFGISQRDSKAQARQ